MPRIRLAIERVLQALPQFLASDRIFDHDLLRMLEPHPRDVVHGALEIPAFFAIELQERARMLQHFLGRLHLDEELRDFGLDAAVAGDIDLPPGIDADHADVLDPRLGAIARTSGDGKLHLVRRVHSPQRALQVLAHLRRVLGAKAAPLAAHAGLHGAQGLCVCMTRRHIEVLPYAGQICFLYAEQIDALPAGDFHRRNLVLVDDIRDPPQL